MYQFAKKEAAKKVFAIAIGTLIVTNFSGCSLFPNENSVQAPVLLKAPEASYKTQPVKKGTIIRQISSNGTLVSRAGENLSFASHGGRISCIKVKAGDSVKKGELIAQLDTNSLNYDLKKAKIQLEKAQVTYQLEVDAKSDSNRLKLADLDVQESQLEVDEIQEELQKATLTAPITGKVEFVVNLKIGDQIAAYETVATIGDESQIEVECTGTGLDNFKIGMKANIEYNSHTYSGVVVTVPDTSSASANNKKAVVVKFDQIPQDTKLGDNASVAVTLEKKENVIVIPADKVKDFGGKYYVSVLDKGAKVDKLVEIGIKTDTEVEITKGLTEGDNYITES